MINFFESLKTRWQFLRYLLVTLLMVLWVVSCNRPIPQPIVSNSPTSACQTIEHTAGKTEICGQVEKVAVLSPPLLDILLSLGVQPAAYAEVDLLGSSAFDRPSEQIPYLGDRVSTQPINLGDRDNPSIETLVQLKPDLILGESSQNTNYKLFSEIAPTVLFEVQGKTGWQTVMPTIADVLDREEQAQRAIAAYDQQVEAAKQKLTPLIAGQSIIVLGWNRISNQSFIFEPNDFIYGVLEDLGFQIIAGEPGRPELSIEILSQIEADHILVMPSGDNTIENAKQQWHTNPILQSIPAVKAGKIYFMDYQLTRIRGPIAAEIFINQFQALLANSSQNSL